MKRMISSLIVLLLACSAIAEMDFAMLLQQAEQGDAAAQVASGDCYYEDNGAELDYTVASQWYMKAAEQGDMEGQYKLGCCYLNGHGVRKDMQQATYWLMAAAEQGVADQVQVEEDLLQPEESAMSVSLSVEPQSPEALRKLVIRYYYGQGGGDEP